MPSIVGAWQSAPEGKHDRGDGMVILHPGQERTPS
jgi:hypothetical protein